MKLLQRLMFMLLASGVVLLTSCSDDDDEPKIDPPVAGFNTNVDGLTVTVTNTTLNADSYAWDFGDEAGTSTSENPEYTYEAGGTYTITLTATNEGGDNVATAEVTVEEPVVVDPILVDFETDVVLEAFGGSAAAIIANPDASGINTSGNVVETVHGNETWAGFYFDLDAPLNLSASNDLKVKVWAPDAGFNFRLKIENVDDATDFHEYDVAIPSGGEWVELSFDLTSDINGNPAASETYARIVLFPGWDVADAGTFYVDDVSLN